MIKAIIFDYDGVIVDSVAQGIEVYKEMAHALGVKGFNSVKEFRHAHIYHHHRIYDEWGLNEKQQAAATAIYEEASLRLNNMASLILGMDKIIPSLAKKYKLVIASGNYRTIIESRLKEMGLLKYFSFIVTSRELKMHKPDPQILLHCVEKLGVKREEAVFVGDQVMDIEMGKAAGIRTIIVCGHSWNPKKALLNMGPDVVVESVKEMAEAIEDG